MLNAIFKNLPFWERGNIKGDGPFLIDPERDMTEAEVSQFCVMDESLSLGVGFSHAEFQAYLALKMMECRRVLSEMAMIDGDDPETARILNENLQARYAFYGDNGAKADYCLTEINRAREQKQVSISSQEMMYWGGRDEAFTEMFNRYSE